MKKERLSFWTGFGTSLGLIMLAAAIGIVCLVAGCATGLRLYTDCCATIAHRYTAASSDSQPVAAACGHTFSYTTATSHTCLISCPALRRQAAGVNPRIGL